jgi:hypothetical protein
MDGAGFDQDLAGVPVLDVVAYLLDQDLDTTEGPPAISIDTKKGASRTVRIGRQVIAPDRRASLLTVRNDTLSSL